MHGFEQYCLIIDPKVKVYVDNKFPEGYVPTVFENTYLIKEYRGLRVNLGIWDTGKCFN